MSKIEVINKGEDYKNDQADTHAEKHTDLESRQPQHDGVPPEPPASPDDESDSYDPDTVTWDSPSDTANPTNWSAGRRWSLIFVAAFITFLSSVSSSMFAPSVPQLMDDFNSTNSVLGSFVVTVYVLGLGTGPLWWAPLSELYGRLPIQHIGNLGFLAFTIMCARSTSLGMLIVARLLQGTFATSSMTIGGAIIADTTRQEKRGFALSVYTLGILVGPSIGPVAGGFLSGAKGWRWIFWVISIVLAAFTLLCFVVWRETYPPIILERKAESLRKATGNHSFRTPYDRGLSRTAYFKRGIGRVFKMLFYSPIILMLSIHMGLVYSYFYLLLTTLTPVFEDQYGWSADISGLAYMGVGVGFVVSQFIYAGISDRLLKSMAAKSESGEMKPEYRLPATIVGAFLVPVAMFWYGWSAEAQVQWIVPIIGSSLLGFGNTFIFMGIQSYTIDAFTLYAASGLAANTVVRSIMAGVVPLAAPKMYAALGLGWGNSLLAFLALAMVPVPWLFMMYGERLRKFNGEKLKNL